MSITLAKIRSDGQYGVKNGHLLYLGKTSNGAMGHQPIHKTSHPIFDLSIRHTRMGNGAEAEGIPKQ